jgi:hypothetical protein
LMVGCEALEFINWDIETNPQALFEY